MIEYAAAPFVLLITTCPGCGDSVTSEWVPGGGCLSRAGYVLVADWIFHAACWDETVEREFGAGPVL